MIGNIVKTRTRRKLRDSLGLGLILTFVSAINFFSIQATAAPKITGAKPLPCPQQGVKRSAYFEVCHVSTKLNNRVYVLNSRLYYGLSAPVFEALKSGVAITLQIHVEIIRDRNWMWDETVANLHQTYRIRFHALSQFYVVTNVNTGASASYTSIESAVESISEIDQLPILDKKLLGSNQIYFGRLRTRLVLWDLPSPLRLWAYMSGDWRLRSDWAQWQL